MKSPTFVKHGLNRREESNNGALFAKITVTSQVMHEFQHFGAFNFRKLSVMVKSISCVCHTASIVPFRSVPFLSVPGFPASRTHRQQTSAFLKFHEVHSWSYIHDWLLGVKEYTSDATSGSDFSHPINAYDEGCLNWKKVWDETTYNVPVTTLVFCLADQSTRKMSTDLNWARWSRICTQVSVRGCDWELWLRVWMRDWELG